jgi:hypothetical protein
VLWYVLFLFSCVNDQSAASIGISTVSGKLHKGDHVLVDGQLVSLKYENENGKSKKAKASKVIVFSSVRANSVLRLSLRGSGNPRHCNDYGSCFRPAFVLPDGSCDGPPASPGGLFRLSCFPATAKKSELPARQLERIRLLRRLVGRRRPVPRRDRPFCSQVCAFGGSPHLLRILSWFRGVHRVPGSYLRLCAL